MAISLNGSSQYLEHSSAVLTGTPITMACWFKSASSSANQDLMSLGKTSSNSKFQLHAEGGTAGDPINARLSNDSTPADCRTSSGYSTNTWTHAAAVFASSTDRTSYINGGSAGTSTSNITPVNIGRTRLGRDASVGGGNYLNGVVAEAAIWNAALTSAEILQLARGTSPLLVKPGDLVAYWRLFGTHSPEPDHVGGFDMTLVNTPTKTEHPRTFERYDNTPLIVPSANANLLLQANKRANKKLALCGGKQ